MSYLAHATIGAGGSWARDADKAKAIQAFRNIVVADWGSLYDVQGKPMKVAIYDVGDAEVTMSHQGVYVTGTEPPQWIEPLEVATVILPRKRRRRA